MRTRETVSLSRYRVRCACAYLDSGLDALKLNRLGLPDAILLHVHQGTGVTVQTPCGLALNVLGPHAGEDTDRAGTGVLCQCSGDNLHGIGNSLVGPLLDTLNGLGQLAQSDRHGHFNGTTTGGKTGVEDDVPGDGHGVLEVPLDLVDDVLGGAAEKDSASLGVLALSEEGEVLVANLLDLEKSALSSNVGLLEVVDPVHDGRTRGSGDTVVIGLSHTAEGGNVGLHQVVLGKVLEVLASRMPANR